MHPYKALFGQVGFCDMIISFSLIRTIFVSAKIGYKLQREISMLEPRDFYALQDLSPSEKRNADSL